MPEELDRAVPAEMAEAPTPEAPAGEVTEKGEEPKHPSKFFVEYYGSIVLFVIGLAVASAVVFLRPIINGIKQTNADVEQRITTIQDERRYLSTLEQSVAAARSIEPNTLAKVESALPDESAIPSLLLQFGDAAQRNGLKIDNISFTDIRPAQTGPAARSATTTNVQPVDITVALRARNYLDVKRFLTDVESSLRLMDVLGMTSGLTGAELAYTLQLRTYVFIPQQKPATP